MGFVYIFFVAMYWGITPAEGLQESPPSQTELKNQVFVVSEYQVFGNSLLSGIMIERTLYPYLGERKTVSDLEQARSVLETYYKDQGFPAVAVSLPEQNIKEGIVRLQVVEGKIDRVRISGARYYSPALIRSEIDALHRGGDLYLPLAQQQIQAANTSGLQRMIQPLLRAGRVPGTVEVELKVRDQNPFDAGFEINDRHSQGTTDLRSNIALGYHNLWQRGHSFGTQFQTAPEKPDEVNVWSFNYVSRFSNHKSLTGLYIRSRSENTSIGDLAVIGQGDIFGFRFSLPFAQQAQSIQSLILALDYKNFDESISIQGSDQLNTPIDYSVFSLQYKYQIQFIKTVLQYDAQNYFGLRGVGSREQMFADKRFRAKPNFYYIRAGARMTSRLWFDSVVDLELEAQMADSPLISNEQYSSGGANSVRGYYESQLLGDDAVQFKIQWHTPSFGGQINHGIGDMHLLVFYDAAAVHIQHELPAQRANRSILSTGLGLRVAMWGSLFAAVDWALPLRDAAEIQAGTARWHFSVNYRFQGKLAK